MASLTFDSFFDDVFNRNINIIAMKKISLWAKHYPGYAVLLVVIVKLLLFSNQPHFKKIEIK